MKKHIIDLDADPLLPSGVTLLEHKKGGTIEWNPAKFELYTTEAQKENWVSGDTLYEQFKNDPAVMNVNLANWLVAHPNKYPDAWKGKWIYFWGTIVLLRGGRRGVPYLFGGGGGVGLRWDWLDGGWRARSPALRLASSQSLETQHSDSLPFALPDTLMINGVPYDKRV